MNIDKRTHKGEVEKRWFELTKSFIKVDGFNGMLKKFLKAAEEVTEQYWFNNNNKIPNHFFKINSNTKITDIADEFNIKPLGKKLRICPFHEDKDPSLSLSDEKSVFNCFGCGMKGNIITFYALLKKVKNNANK